MHTMGRNEFVLLQTSCSQRWLLVCVSSATMVFDYVQQVTQSGAHPVVLLDCACLFQPTQDTPMPFSLLMTLLFFHVVWI